MSKFKTRAKYKVTQEAKGSNLEMGHLYLYDVPVTYAQVIKPSKKYQSEDTAYQINLFVDKATLTQLEEIGLNKEMAEVGVTKIKKGTNRGQLKYKLDDVNGEYDGMFAAQFSRDTVKRDKAGAFVKNISPLKVVDHEGNEFTQDVGNGSICTVKMFAYRNEENLLVVMLDTVVVLQHVAYNKEDSYYDEELGITIKIGDKPSIDPDLVNDSPKQSKPAKTQAKPSQVSDANDSESDGDPF